MRSIETELRDLLETATRMRVSRTAESFGLKAEKYEGIGSKTG